MIQMETRLRCEHNDDFECFSCAQQRHDQEHFEPVRDCLTCKLRSIQISPAALTVRREMKLAGELPNPPPTVHHNQGNGMDRGVATDSRNMPLLKPDGSSISLGEYRRNRRKIDEGRRMLATHPDPFGTGTRRD